MSAELGKGSGADLADVVRRTLDERELEYEEAQPGAFLVKLPGAHKLATIDRLVIGDHSLHVEAFFCRKPDERGVGLYRWLLERNARMFAVSFAIDKLGDDHLTGRLA